MMQKFEPESTVQIRASALLRLQVHRQLQFIEFVQHTPDQEAAHRIAGNGIINFSASEIVLFQLGLKTKTYAALHVLDQGANCRLAWRPPSSIGGKRRSAELSQSEAAAELGVPVKTLQNWEQGGPNTRRGGPGSPGSASTALA